MSSNTATEKTSSSKTKNKTEREIQLPINPQQRQHDITGAPPRINPTLTEEQNHAAKTMMADISGAASGTKKPNDTPPSDLIKISMCHPELFKKVVGVSLALLKEPSLPLRDRQLVILTVGWLKQSPYIWGEHVIISKKLGLTEEDINQVKMGPSSHHWSPHEKALLQATQQLISCAMINDDTWAIIAATYTDKQLYELPVLVGQFSTVCYFQNALRIPLDSANAGLLS